MSSSSSIFASRRGSTEPSGWGAVSDSKARTTCTSASTPRRAGRSTSAPPSPFATPGTSTYSTVASVRFFGWKIAASRSTRGSGTRATPTRASGRPPGGVAGVPVRSWKRVLFPARESPRMPAFMRRLYRGARDDRGGAPATSPHGVESAVGDAARPTCSRAPGGSRAAGRRRPLPAAPGRGSRHPLPGGQLRLAAAPRPRREAGGRAREDVHLPAGPSLPADPVRGQGRDLGRRRLAVPQRRAVDGLLPRLRAAKALAADVPPRHRPAHGAAHGRDRGPRPEGLARRAERLGRALALDPQDGGARRRDGHPPLRRAGGGPPRRRGGERPRAVPRLRPRHGAGRERTRPPPPSPRPSLPSSRTTASCCGSSSTAWRPTRA